MNNFLERVKPMNIYIFMFLLVILLTPILKGTLKYNKTYIVLMSMILFGVCAFRGVRVGADLGRYETHFRICLNLDFQSIFTVYGWDCIGFYELIKLFQIFFGDNFHGFLFTLATIEGLIFGYIIYKHSVNPYMSVMLYMALGYYAFIYSGLKQALATAVVMLAFDFLIRRKYIFFLIITCIAGLIHTPAILFMGAIIIAHKKINWKTVIVYFIVTGIMFVFSRKVAVFLVSAYDSIVDLEGIGGVGGKLIMMSLFIIAGYVLRIPNDENKTYLCLFNFMIVASILQILAVYGNVFERLADYYFIFSVLYLPLVFEKIERRRGSIKGIVLYDEKIYILSNIVLIIFSLIYFYVTINNTYGLLPYYI